MKKISISIPDDLLKELDEHLSGESRSAFFRSILRDKLYHIKVMKIIEEKKRIRMLERDEELNKPSGATLEFIDMKITPRRPGE